MWTLVPWSSDAGFLIPIYRFIDHINWDRDFFFVFGTSHQPRASIQSFFADLKLTYKIYTINQFVVDIRKALDFQIE